MTFVVAILERKDIMLYLLILIVMFLGGALAWTTFGFQRHMPHWS